MTESYSETGEYLKKAFRYCDCHCEWPSQVKENIFSALKLAQDNNTLIGGTTPEHYTYLQGEIERLNDRLDRANKTIEYLKEKEIKDMLRRICKNVAREADRSMVSIAASAMQDEKTEVGLFDLSEHQDIFKAGYREGWNDNANGEEQKHE